MACDEGYEAVSRCSAYIWCMVQYKIATNFILPDCSSSAAACGELVLASSAGNVLRSNACNRAHAVPQPSRCCAHYCGASQNLCRNDNAETLWQTVTTADPFAQTYAACTRMVTLHALVMASLHTREHRCIMQDSRSFLQHYCSLASNILNRPRFRGVW